MVQTCLIHLHLLIQNQNRADCRETNQMGTFCQLLVHKFQSDLLALVHKKVQRKMLFQEDRASRVVRVAGKLDFIKRFHQVMNKKTVHGSSIENNLQKVLNRKSNKLTDFN